MLVGCVSLDEQAQKKRQVTEKANALAKYKNAETSDYCNYLQHNETQTCLAIINNDVNYCKDVDSPSSGSSGNTIVDLALFTINQSAMYSAIEQQSILNYAIAKKYYGQCKTLGKKVAKSVKRYSIKTTHIALTLSKQE